MNYELIQGKGNIKGIVSMEDIGDGTMEIFVQDENGKVSSLEQKHDYWIITDIPGDKQSIALEGNGYYKYKNPFATRSDFDFAKRYFNKLSTKRAFFVNDAKEQFMLQSGETYFKDLTIKNVSVLSFDIETTGLEHNDDSKVLIISNTFRDSSGNVERKLFCYDEYGNDKEMFEAWCEWVCLCNPSIMLGHNIYGYDLPFLDHCSSNVGASLTLGRKKQAIRFNSWTSKYRKDANQFIDYQKCHIYGREIVDTMFLAIKYDVGRKYESYGLKSIIENEGLQVTDRQFYDASLIRKNYTIPEEWEKIKKYALHDADDALALYDLMAPSYFYMTQNIPKSFQEMICTASGSQLNSMMVRAYLQEGHSLPKASEPLKFQGAISVGNTGVYRNILKADVSSLYPSIMIEYEIYDKFKDPKGYFKEIVKTFTEQRLINKKLAKTSKYHDDLQASAKILINSCYGFLGSQGLLFNSPANASLITEHGRRILTIAMDWVKKTKEYRLVNADTDAVSFCNEKMTPFSGEEQESLLKELNSLYPETIHFEHDGYFPFFMVLAAKNYVMQTEDGKIKIRGSSLKDQKKEPALLEFIREIINAIIVDKKEPELREIYYKYVKEAMDVKDIKRWCSKKTITEAVMKSPRSNETKVKDAIAGTDYRIADKVYMFFKEDETLSLMEKYDGDYNRKRLLEKLYNTAQVFDSVLNVEYLFRNYKLRKNWGQLKHVIEGTL